VRRPAPDLPGCLALSSNPGPLEGRPLDDVRFGAHVRDDNRDRIPPSVRLKAVCGPGG
jgi:hypothetical protein